MFLKEKQGGWGRGGGGITGKGDKEERGESLRWSEDGVLDTTMDASQIRFR